MLYSVCMKIQTIEERLGPKYNELVEELKQRLPAAYVSKTQSAVVSEICKKYSVGEVHVRTKILPQLNLKPPAKERPKTSYSLIKLTDEEAARIVECYEAGLSAQKIFDAKILGDRTPSLSTINNILKKKSAKYKERNSGKGKISKEVGEKILALQKEGKTNEEISAHLKQEGSDVSVTSVGIFISASGIDNSQGKTEDEKFLIYNEYIELGLDGAYESLKASFSKLSKATIHRIAREVIDTYNLPERDNSDSYRTYTLNKDYFEKIDTEDKAYFLGWLATDGNIHKNTVSIEISRQDEAILRELSKFIGSNKPAYYSTHTDKRTGVVCESAKIALFSRKMVEDLRKYGIVPAKSLNLNVDLTQISQELHRHFWRGAIDGDGWTYGSGKGGKHKIELGFCGSLEMMKKFCDYLKVTLNIHETITPDHSIWKIVIDSEPKAAIALKHFYENASIALARKLADAAKAQQ